MRSFCDWVKASCVTAFSSVWWSVRWCTWSSAGCSTLPQTGQWSPFCKSCAKSAAWRDCQAWWWLSNTCCAFSAACWSFSSVCCALSKRDVILLCAAKRALSASSFCKKRESWNAGIALFSVTSSIKAFSVFSCVLASIIAFWDASCVFKTLTFWMRVSCAVRCSAKASTWAWLLSSMMISLESINLWGSFATSKAWFLVASFARSFVLSRSASLFLSCESAILASSLNRNTVSKWGSIGCAFSASSRFCRASCINGACSWCCLSICVVSSSWENAWLRLSALAIVVCSFCTSPVLSVILPAMVSRLDW